MMGLTAELSLANTAKIENICIWKCFALVNINIWNVNNVYWVMRMDHLAACRYDVWPSESNRWRSWRRQRRTGSRTAARPPATSRTSWSASSPPTTSSSSPPGSWSPRWRWHWQQMSQCCVVWKSFSLRDIRRKTVTAGLIFNKAFSFHSCW